MPRSTHIHFNGEVVLGRDVFERGAESSDTASQILVNEVGVGEMDGTTLVDVVGSRNDEPIDSPA